MRAKSAGALVLVVALVLLVVSIVLRDSSPTVEKDPPTPSPTPSATGPYAKLLDEVYARFDPQSPGRGVTDYPGATVEDIPKSYAMIVLAELERARHGIRPDLPNLARPAGQWLLDHADLEVDGTVGWGLPVAWDAYGDGSENPAGTVYAISTGIAADALMTWMEADPEAPSDEIVATLSTALDNFAQAPTTPDGLIPYSLQPSDRPYDTFNPAAFVAGQMQRFVKYTPDPSLARRLTESADATVASLVRNHRTSPSKSWYWRYSIQEDNANDMPHASYIIEGLRTYVRESGALAAEVDLPRVMSHLREFFSDEGRPRAWPTFQADIDRPPRLYDVGNALALACSEPDLAPLADTLVSTIGSYRDPGGGGFLKFPVGTPDQDALVVNEYEAYLWRGLVACASDDLANPAAARSFTRTTSSQAATARADTGGPVPFVRVGDAPGDGEVTFARGRSSLDLPWSPERRVEVDGLVLRAIDDDAGGVLLVRGFPRNDLTLVALDESGTAAGELGIEVSPGSAPILRAATFSRGVLHVVFYDNPTLINYLARFERRDGGYAALGEPVALPSFEDPSGGTYEMVPAVFLVAGREDLHLVAGTLEATIHPDGTVASARLPNCLRALEAAPSPAGPIVLCQQAEEEGPGAPYELHGPDGIVLPSLDNREGTPFRLRFEDDRAQLSFADTPAALADMLRFDLERTDAGWLELGTDNVEGRVAWSQIYYLNGFLDFLQLANGSGDRWREFSDVLTGMRARLDQEIAIADRHWRTGRFETRAFTVDRSPALFAVQTSRLLLLMERYASELPDPSILPGRRRLRADVSALAGHIDVMSDEGQEAWWWPRGQPYLAWPKGSAFAFDGLNVPYNHQNEWAYAMTRAEGVAHSGATAQGIVMQFLRRVAPDGRLPQTGTWDYWWGQAYDGWTSADGVSTNTPDYDGDHIAAAKSFRSIDAMSVLTVAPELDRTTRAHLRSSAATLVAQDKLYPFVAYELGRAGVAVELPDEVVRRYIRVTSPWEIQNAAWAYSAELERLVGGH